MFKDFEGRSEASCGWSGGFVLLRLSVWLSRYSQEEIEPSSPPWGEWKAVNRERAWFYIDVEFKQ